MKCFSGYSVVHQMAKERLIHCYSKPWSNFKTCSVMSPTINIKVYGCPLENDNDSSNNKLCSGEVSHTKPREKHRTFDPESPFDWMAFLHRLPSRCRPLVVDTWLTGALMATRSAPLNNGRLRHNHPQRGEDSR